MLPPRSSGREYNDSGMRYASGSSIGTLASPSSTRWGNTYGLSPQFLDSLGISGPIFSRIFVANVSLMSSDRWNEKRNRSLTHVGAVPTVGL